MELYTQEDMKVMDESMTAIEAHTRGHLHMAVRYRTKDIVKDSIDYVVWDAVHDITLSYHQEPIA